MEDKPLVSAREREMISKAVLSWLNSYPDLPVEKVEYEYLSANGITMSTVRQPYRSRDCVDGSYEAEFVFNVVYRDRPTNAEYRASMDIELDKIGGWCESTKPVFEGDITIRRIVCTQGVAMTARYEDGTEDHQITLKLIYHVRNNKW